MNKEHGKIDAFLLIIVVVLVIFGIVMVFSASFYSTIGTEEGPYHYLRLSIQWAVFGLVVMIVASFIPYRVYYGMAPIVMAVSLFLLLLLFTPLGKNVGGATRWLGVGDYTIMPGEIAKLAVIIGCAWFYTKYANQTKTFLYGFGLIALTAVIYFYLIYKQPNLSTAMIILLLFVAMMFIAGTRLVYLAVMIVASFFAILYRIRTSEGEHLTRITGFLDPFADAQDTGFQVVQGLIALGTGGLTGTGLGNSVSKALWLPFAQNDFIFAIIGEETGFIGCIIVLAVYVILVWRCLMIAMRCKDRFAMLLAGGVGILLALQVILNIGVVTSVLPPTGIILPFISYGGNAVVLFMFLIGVVLNISRGDDQYALYRRRRRRGESVGASESRKRRPDGAGSAQASPERGRDIAPARRRRRRRESRS